MKKLHKSRMNLKVKLRNLKALSKQSNKIYNKIVKLMNFNNRLR